jgi:hypothetical protein
MMLQSELGEILLKSRRAMSHATNIAKPTATYRGSHLLRTFPSNGPQRPQTKNGHHRQNESPALPTCSVIMLTTLNFLYNEAI